MIYIILWHLIRQPYADGPILMPWYATGCGEMTIPDRSRVEVLLIHLTDSTDHLIACHGQRDR